MPYKLEIAARKPARNYRDPNDNVSGKAAENRSSAAKDGSTEPVDETNEKMRRSGGKNVPIPGPSSFPSPGGSEQPGYRMKRARFWQS